MDAVTRNVSDLPSADRAAIEHVLGYSLANYQQVIIAAVPQGEQTLPREAARVRILKTLQRTAQHAADAGITDAEADAAVAEAMTVTRPRSAAT